MLQGCMAPQESLAAPSSLLIPCLAGLSERHKCHGKICPWPNPAPCIPFPWLECCSHGGEGKSCQREFSLPDRKSQVEPKPQSATGWGSGSSAPWEHLGSLEAVPGSDAGTQERLWRADLSGFVWNETRHQRCIFQDVTTTFEGILNSWGVLKQLPEEWG